jgi:predicted nucleic acid-binding protein
MIFIDTGVWLYLFDERQDSAQREKAIAFAASIEEPVCTSDLIIAESHKWLIHHGRSRHQIWCHKGF